MPESTSQSEQNLRKALWEEANRVVIDATYSGRAHQMMGTDWNGINRFLGLPAVILSTLLAGGAGVTILVGVHKWIPATLALVSAGLTAARSFLRADETAEQNGLKGDRLINLRNDAIRFQQIDLLSSLSLDALSDRCKILSERRNSFREQPPRHIPKSVYERVKKSIESGESDYENDRLWQQGPF